MIVLFVRDSPGTGDVVTQKQVETDENIGMYHACA